MSNICHVAFSFVVYTAIWDEYMAELGVIVNHFALAEHLKYVVFRAMQKE